MKTDKLQKQVDEFHKKEVRCFQKQSKHFAKVKFRAYYLDKLSLKEKEAFEKHLIDCQPCKDKLDEMNELIIHLVDCEKKH